MALLIPNFTDTESGLTISNAYGKLEKFICRVDDYIEIRLFVYVSQTESEAGKQYIRMIRPTCRKNDDGQSTWFATLTGNLCEDECENWLIDNIDWLSDATKC